MRRTATSPPTPPWCWPRPRARSRATSPSRCWRASRPTPTWSTARSPGRASSTSSSPTSFWRERLRDCLKEGIAYGDSQMGGGREGQRRIRLGQSDRPAARGACARRGGGRCARQPARQGGLRRHQGILHQRRRRAGRQARPVDLPALPARRWAITSADSRRPLSRRVSEGGRRGDRQARRRALDRQARGRLAARDARLRHLRPDGRDQGRPRDAGRPHRRLFLGACAGRVGRGRSRLPGARRART